MQYCQLPIGIGVSVGIPIYYGPMGDAVKWRKLYRSCGQSQRVDWLLYMCAIGLYLTITMTPISQHISEGPCMCLAV